MNEHSFRNISLFNGRIMIEGAQLLDRSCGGQPDDQGSGRGPLYLAILEIDARVEANDRRRASLSRWCPAAAKFRTNDPQIPRRYGIAWAAQGHGALPFPANAVAGSLVVSGPLP